MKIQIKEQVNPTDQFEIEIEYEPARGNLVTYERYVVGLVAKVAEPMLKFLDEAVRTGEVEEFEEFEALLDNAGIFCIESYASIVGYEMYYYNSLGVKHRVEWEL